MKGYSILDASIMVTIIAPLVWWLITKQNQSEEKIRKESEFTANLLKGLSDGFAASNPVLLRQNIGTCDFIVLVVLF